MLTDTIKIVKQKSW